MAWKSQLQAPVVEADQGVDLSRVLAMGSVVTGGGVASTDRSDSDSQVELLEDEPAPVSDEPREVDAFIDGIQASLLLAYRDHRPVRLAHIAAGAATGAHTAHPDLVGLVEKVAVVASVEDRPWLSEDDRVGNVPVHYVEATSPPEVETATSEWISSTRDGAERRLSSLILDSGAGLVAVDGHLLNRPVDDRLFGIVKSTRTRYLPDESVLYSLPQAWRSPIFRLPAKPADRYSCYVRLQSGANAAWSHGLIRLESYKAELLPALCATALAYRQDGSSSDPRWDRHLLPVRVTEQLLRSRRPSLF